MGAEDFVFGHAPVEHKAGLSADSRIQPRTRGVVAKAPQPPAIGCHHFVVKRLFGKSPRLEVPRSPP